ncbi:hypothetical protein VTG60DRAFT_4959 [Thermothelomyces hinnuleus]
MAEPHNDDPNFGNREEDWPDPDVDSSTEEGAETTRRSETALYASMDRDIQKRRRAMQAAQGDIPQSLYDEARDYQDQLTEEERQLLLSRGDVLGKALAYPDSLTTEEIHKALRWPPPDVVRANIQRATGGTLSTPTELYAKAKDALDRGQFDTIISDDEASLIANSCYDDHTYCPSRAMVAHGIPGFGPVLTLLSDRLGLDVTVFKAAWLRRLEVAWRRMRLGNLPEEDFLARINSYNASLQAVSPIPRIPFIPPPVPSSSQVTPFTMVAMPAPLANRPLRLWPLAPSFILPEGAVRILQEDTGSCGYDLCPGWAALPGDQKEAYRARSEARRREQQQSEVWEGDLNPPEFIRKNFPRAVGHQPVVPVSGFELFRDELAPEPGPGPGPATRDWGFRGPYDNRAWLANKPVSSIKPADKWALAREAAERLAARAAARAPAQ